MRSFVHAFTFMTLTLTLPYCSALLWFCRVSVCTAPVWLTVAVWCVRAVRTLLLFGYLQRHLLALRTMPLFSGLLMTLRCCQRWCL
jgi:hypothetical protein